MGTNRLLRNSLLAATGIAGLTLSACASSGHQADVYDYESGSCYGASCAKAPAPAPAYQPAMPVSPGVVYTDCSQVPAMECGYAEPAPTYTPPTPTYTAPVDCPAGTTAQPDGTCLQTSSSTYTSTTTQTYTPPMSVDCPAGTTPQSDGTCMQTGSSYGGYTSTRTYTEDDYLPVRK